MKAEGIPSMCHHFAVCIVLWRRGIEGEGEKKKKTQNQDGTVLSAGSASNTINQSMIPSSMDCPFIKFLSDCQAYLTVQDNKRTTSPASARHRPTLPTLTVQLVLGDQLVLGV
ncbi:hypothetical protein E2C01_018886 [Portunus trituberculatus]|uniref:Uncharacterized protein n=1 Tax=Portunus trituberculatus TaxID=210409 RepID=A0A5B7DYA6_PORTR|nr:hypothetical protein [Portunus trituberculatus]